MIQLSPQSLWGMKRKDLLDVLEKDLSSNLRRKIRFYSPGFMYYKTDRYSSSCNDFPTISITGNGCALNCKHCGATVLNTMYPATTPESLFETCLRFKQKGASGCLISGGCLPNGSVPLGRFVGAIAKIRRELGLTIFVHTGIIDVQTAKALKDGGVNGALLDIIGSDETIREIYNLHVSVDDYADSLRALQEVGIPFMPHVIAGLHYGKLKGELRALEMVSEYKPSALIIIAFMPIRKTEMANVRPATPVDVARVVAVARLMFPKTPLVLGCMRPRDDDRVETEILAMKGGVDAIAFPTNEAVKFAEEHGCETTFSSFCCAQIYRDLQS